MPTTKTWAGSSFDLPLNREPKGSWGTQVSNFLIALANNAVALTGGTQTLSAELNFGATYGVVQAYVKSASANIASAGFVRLARSDSVTWRNNANDADLTLSVSTTDKLQFNSIDLADTSSAQTLTTKTIVAADNTITTAASGNLTSTELNAALAELQSDVDTRAASTTVTAHTGASSGVHGITGSVVGTTDTQTLSGKTIDGASNTLTVRLANDVSGTLPIGSGGTGQTSADAALNALLPSQTGNGGKVLSTDGSATSWASAASSTLTAQFVDVGNGSNTRTATNTSLLGSIQASTSSAAVTVTIASPGVLTLTSHGLSTGQTVYLTTTGALPTGLSASTTYYVIKIDADTFKLATSRGNAFAGTAINTSGTQSGTHTLFSGGLTVGSNGLPGNTGGSAITKGYVGEVVNGSAITDNTTLTTTPTTASSMTLSAGVWMIFYELTVEAATSANANAQTQVGAKITDNSGTAIGNSYRGLLAFAPTAASYIVQGPIRGTEFVAISSDTIYKLQAARQDVSGTAGSAHYYNNTTSGSAESIFKAVRIA